MSGKLDQSLDEIMKDRKPASKGRRGRLPNRKAAVKSKAATTAVIAPAGGIQKKGKVAKPTRGAAPPAPAATGDSKISVSNLPEDVNEGMIKEYFGTAVAPVKKVILNYGPQGRSRGSATVTFGKPTAAAQAATKLDGLKVEGKVMRVEVVMGAKSIAPVAAPKGLAERVQPKNAAQEHKKHMNKKEAQPKAAAAATTNGEGKGKKKRTGRAGRPKAKTADELDAEMQDYFGGDAAPTNGAAQPATAPNGGDAMVDEVM
ncbi:related to RNA annealing [Lecanosticta acicola]|uniref:Related to RNA annealing n=1 Tax=Lecanosticta acicola TaxID=111012 RepID=A0AAI9ECW4_9PEZI|nr:related to RNA annealing [Lecanosticta acicola]